MNLKINACMFLAIGSLVFLGIFARKFKNRLTMRDFVIGTTVYVAAKVLFYQIEYAAISSLFGDVSRLLQNSALMITDALITVAVYLLIYRFFYRYEKNEKTAFSLGAGASALEIVSSVTYVLFTYGMMMQSVLTGKAADQLLSQGFSQAAVESAIANVSNISIFSILFIGLQMFLILMTHIICSILVYRNITDEEKKYTGYGLAVFLACNLVTKVIAPLSGIAGLAAEVILILLEYYYMVNDENSPVRDTIMNFNNKKVKRRK